MVGTGTPFLELTVVDTVPQIRCVKAAIRHRPWDDLFSWVALSHLSPTPFPVIRTLINTVNHNDILTDLHHDKLVVLQKATGEDESGYFKVSCHLGC